jgi:RNA polymerase sigma-70 factor (ECF subfamily)
MHDLSEEQLLDLAACEPQAFGRLVEMYHDALLRYVGRISFFSMEDKEDILQNAYIKAYKNINRYDMSMKFSTWLYHIVRNTTIDEIRKQAVRPKLYSFFDEDISKIFVTDESSVKNMWRQEDIQSLRKAISELPEKYREALTLRYVEDKTYEEIMDIVELPKGTVAARISRAKKMITANIQPTNLFHT